MKCMTNLLASFFTVIVLAFGSQAQINILFPFADLNTSHYDLKGQVKEVKQTQYLAPHLSSEIIGEYLLDQDTFHYNLVFDSLGRATHVHRISRMFDFEERYNYVQGVLQCFSWAKNYLNCYVYNESGQIVEDVGYYISEISGRKRRESTKYEYDSAGKLIRSYTTDLSDRITESEFWIYNENGDLIEHWDYSYQFADSAQVPFDTIWHHYKVQYKKDLVHIISFDSNSEFNNKGKYTFRHEKSKVIYERYQEYDKEKCVVDDTYYLKDGLIYKSSGLFGEALKLIEYTYSYQFDSQGNWTKKIASISGKAVKITTREIVYY